MKSAVLAACLVAFGAAPSAFFVFEARAESPAKPAALSVNDAWARSTPPKAMAGGAFMAIVGGPEDDRLIAAKADVSERVELHTHTMDAKGVMSMMKVEGGIPVKAGETVRLQPGGLHIMFIGLKAPLVEGQSFKATLVFEKAGEKAVEIPVLSPKEAMKRMEAAGAHQGH